MKSNVTNNVPEGIIKLYNALLCRKIAVLNKYIIFFGNDSITATYLNIITKVLLTVMHVPHSSPALTGRYIFILNSFNRQ